jgi:membrane-associated phospholipid phosphatase
MLGLVLIEFIVRYFIRVYNVKRLFKALLIVIGVCLQGLVVFSRIFLGMHAINQVLFGITLGLYFLVIYYTYMKKNIIKMC